jgi:hypothetical protein
MNDEIFNLVVRSDREMSIFNLKCHILNYSYLVKMFGLFLKQKLNT